MSEYVNSGLRDLFHLRDLFKLNQGFVNESYSLKTTDHVLYHVPHLYQPREIKKIFCTSVDLPNFEDRCNALCTYQTNDVDPENEKLEDVFNPRTRKLSVIIHVSRCAVLLFDDLMTRLVTKLLSCRVDIPLPQIVMFDTHNNILDIVPVNNQKMAIIQADNSTTIHNFNDFRKSNPISCCADESFGRLSKLLNNSLNLLTDYVTTTKIGLLFLSLCVLPIQLMIYFALSPFLTHWTTKTLLLFCMGACPVSTLPSNEMEHESFESHLSERQSSTIWTLELHGWPNTGYCAMMSFGINDQQTFCLIVDTGSANTAVAAESHPALGSFEYYDMNLSGEDFEEMGKSVTVTYSSGEWSGYLVQDMIGFAGGNFTMATGVFSLITSSTEFFIEGAEWVGILGLAYKSLAKPDSSMGTVWESIRKASSLRDVFSLQLCPPKQSTLFAGHFIEQGGSMTLGGVNETLYQVGKPIYYTKIVKERYYNILLTNISVGEKNINMSCKEFNNDKTIVDSGTTDIYFPTDVFEEVKNSFSDFFEDGVPINIPDGFWMGTQKLLWQSAHIEEIYQCFPTLYLSMATDEDSSQEFSLAVVPQLYLRQIDVLAGEEDPEICPEDSPCNAFTFGVKSRALGTVIGGNAMLGYYTVFDRENARVGFAESTCEYRSTESAPYITGPYKREPKDCEYVVDNIRWDILTYFCGALTILISTTMIIITCFVRLKRKRKNTTTMSAVKRALLHSRGACCKTRSDGTNNEGYASDHETVMFDTNEISSSTQHDTMVVFRPYKREISAEMNEVEMNETATGEEETEAASKNKKRGKRHRNRNLPVMETASDHDEVLCIPSLNPVSLPSNAATRANYYTSYIPEFIFNKQPRLFTGDSSV